MRHPTVAVRATDAADSSPGSAPMLNVYSTRRREPRIHVRTPVVVEVDTSEGDGFACETLTIELGPDGASVVPNVPVAIGQIVRFRAVRNPFHARAVFCSTASPDYS